MKTTDFRATTCRRKQIALGLFTQGPGSLG